MWPASATGPLCCTREQASRLKPNQDQQAGGGPPGCAVPDSGLPSKWLGGHWLGGCTGPEVCPGAEGRELAQLQWHLFKGPFSKPSVRWLSLPSTHCHITKSFSTPWPFLCLLICLFVVFLMECYLSTHIVPQIQGRT